MPAIDKYKKYRKDLEFMDRYAAAQNAASGSLFDPNANVSSKSMATLASELHKEANIGANRLAMYDKLTAMYGTDIAETYIAQLEDHVIYRHDESSPVGTPYCASITLMPFFWDGMKKIGGTTGAPKNLDSFCGGFINLIFAVAAQLAGAVATPEFLTYLDYFIRKEYGDDYYLKTDLIVDFSSRRRTLDKLITDKFEQIVYSVNQPAAARGNQAVFWNIAYFDRCYFSQIFDGFVFPDGTPPKWESVSWLQKRFMKWFNKERLRNILTFPVETLSLLHDGERYADPEWADFAAEMYAEGHSFFTYTSDSVDSLSSCCRLRNGITSNVFSYTLGAGGIATGSKCVMTLNASRFIQQTLQSGEAFTSALKRQIHLMHMYLTAFNGILMDRCESHMIPLYDAGFVAPAGQYLTIGVNGFVESAEFLGILPSAHSDAYAAYAKDFFGAIAEVNRDDGTEQLMFNTELVPAENLGVKNARWDKKDGYFVPRDCYNSYFYLVEDEETDVIDQFVLQGSAFAGKCDGGAALHCNLSDHLSKEQYADLLKIAIRTGCNYFTFNIPNTLCRDCGFISKRPLDACPKCASSHLDYATRIIGYLVFVSKWSKERQAEEKRRAYHGGLE